MVVTPVLPPRCFRNCGDAFGSQVEKLPIQLFDRFRLVGIVSEPLRLWVPRIRQTYLTEAFLLQTVRYERKIQSPMRGTYDICRPYQHSRRLKDPGTPHVYRSMRVGNGRIGTGKNPSKATICTMVVVPLITKGVCENLGPIEKLQLKSLKHQVHISRRSDWIQGLPYLALSAVWSGVVIMSTLQTFQSSQINTRSVIIVHCRSLHFSSCGICRIAHNLMAKLTLHFASFLWDV